MSNVFSKASLRIQTPEGVAFSLPLAGVTARFFAYMIDSAVIAVAAIILLWAVTVFQFIAGDLALAAGYLAYFALYMLYGMVFEFLANGQTLGKRVLGIRVADIHGLRLTFSQVAVRNLFRAVDALPSFYLLGGMVALFSPYMQRLGDIAGNTVVISAQEPRRPALEQLEAVRYNSLREYPWIEARLRQRTSPEEAALLVQALLRREMLEPAARVALFAELAGHFREKVRLPEAATAGVTEEQLVRNVVDSLYRDTRMKG